MDLCETGLSLAIRRDDFDISPEYTTHNLVNEWVGPVFPLNIGTKLSTT